jgi:hypothetical protein
MPAACHAAKVASLPPVTYERTPGAAAAPGLRAYRRRQPERTVLHRVVREHLGTVLDEARRRNEDGAGYPAFVEREFEKYLACGQLSQGFARLRCPSCGEERLVAFSCKGRMCPSCWARRAADTAADLVDRVLPEARYRQWVLSFPYGTRFLLAVDGAFLTQMLTAFLRLLFSDLRRRGRRLGIAAGQPGSVAFVQRFGGVLNLNPHGHVLVPDALFVEAPDGSVELVALPPPTDEEVRALTIRIARRLGAISARRLAEANEDGRWRDPERAAMLEAAAEALKLAGTRDDEDDDEPKPLCARIDGFSLHAATSVPPWDREGLEALCRYGLRAPISLDRLSLEPDGKVRCRLLRPWPSPTGRTALVLEPDVLVRRLAALIPPPYQNQIRYHGVFANRNSLRPRLPPPPPRRTAGLVADPSAPPAPVQATQAPASARPPRRHLGWAALLRRALDVDALACFRCAAPMTVLAFLTDPAVVRRILTHLSLPADPLPRAPARRPDEPSDLFTNLAADAPFFDEDAAPGPARRDDTARAPP